MNNELIETVKSLIHNGTHYNIEALEKIYHPDLHIARREQDGSVSVMNREANMQFFQDKRAEGADPLSREATFLYAHASGDTGHVALERRMQLNEIEEHLLYTLVLRKINGAWQVVSEFVSPLD